MLRTVNNPLRILTHLDRYLGSPVELTVYGRAALVLGFRPEPPFTATLDVDVILPSVELDAIEKNDSFWNAVEKLNTDLEPEGLYLTHLFLDTQVILRPDWMKHRVKMLEGTFQHLKIFRPHTVDLILTKMMRVDPDDREDILIYLTNVDWKIDQWLECFSHASVPDISEIQEAFLENQNWLKEVLS